MHDDAAFSVTAIWSPRAGVETSRRREPPPRDERRRERDGRGARAVLPTRRSGPRRYPHERWHPHWGGETAFLTSSRGGLDAEIVLSVLPRPNRLLLFDSEVPHMAKPATVIAAPFAPASGRPPLASTRTAGDRYSVVFRTLCGRETSAELVARGDRDGDGALDRGEAAKLFDKLGIQFAPALLRRLADAGENPGAGRWGAADLDALFHVPGADALRARLRGVAAPR